MLDQVDGYPSSLADARSFVSDKSVLRFSPFSGHWIKTHRGPSPLALACLHGSGGRCRHRGKRRCHAVVHQAVPSAAQP
jgi:hypothetical protein